MRSFLKISVILILTALNLATYENAFTQGGGPESAICWCPTESTNPQGCVEQVCPMTGTTYGHSGYCGTSDDTFCADQPQFGAEDPIQNKTEPISCSLYNLEEHCHIVGDDEGHEEHDGETCVP